MRPSDGVSFNTYFEDGYTVKTMSIYSLCMTPNGDYEIDEILDRWEFRKDRTIERVTKWRAAFANKPDGLSKVVYEYNENNKIISEKVYDKLDNIIGRQDIEYDENGHVINKKNYDGHNILSSCTYDSRGFLTQYQEYTGGKLSSKRTIHAAEPGERYSHVMCERLFSHSIVAVKCWDKIHYEDDYLGTKEYDEYDADGNVILHVEYDKDGNVIE